MQFCFNLIRLIHLIPDITKINNLIVLASDSNSIHQGEIIADKKQYIKALKLLERNGWIARVHANHDILQLCKETSQPQVEMQTVTNLSRAYRIRTAKDATSPAKNYLETCENQLKNGMVSKISDIFEIGIFCTPEMIIKLNRKGLVNISGDYACYASHAPDTKLKIIADLPLTVSDTIRSDLALVYRKQGVNYRILYLYGRIVFARPSTRGNYLHVLSEKEIIGDLKIDLGGEITPVKPKKIEPEIGGESETHNIAEVTFANASVSRAAPRTRKVDVEQKPEDHSIALASDRTKGKTWTKGMDAATNVSLPIFSILEYTSAWDNIAVCRP